MNATSIKTRISPELKHDATDVLNACGLTLSAAVRMFLEQVVQVQGIPFEVKRIPSQKTAKALKEADLIEQSVQTGYNSINEMLAVIEHDKEKTR